MLQLEILVWELFAVNRLAASTVERGEITTLDHELFNDTVEDRTLEVQWLALLSHSLLSRAESPEVLGGLGNDIVEQFKGNATGLLLADLNVKEDART
jgi:hypothetical protein